MYASVKWYVYNVLDCCIHTCVLMHELLQVLNVSPYVGTSTRLFPHFRFIYDTHKSVFIWFAVRSFHSPALCTLFVIIFSSKQFTKVQQQRMKKSKWADVLMRHSLTRENYMQIDCWNNNEKKWARETKWKNEEGEGGVETARETNNRVFLFFNNNDECVVNQNVSEGLGLEFWVLSFEFGLGFVCHYFLFLIHSVWVCVITHTSYSSFWIKIKINTHIFTHWKRAKRDLDSEYSINRFQVKKEHIRERERRAFYFNRFYCSVMAIWKFRCWFIQSSPTLLLRRLCCLETNNPSLSRWWIKRKNKPQAERSSPY